MTTANIRKIVTIIEETHSEADKPIKPAIRRAAAVAGAAAVLSVAAAPTSTVRGVVAMCTIMCTTTTTIAGGTVPGSACTAIVPSTWGTTVILARVS